MNSGLVELNLTAEPDPSNERPSGFWRRQFAQQTTKKQTIFDWMLGVVIPTICVAADPIFFKGGFLGSPLLGAVRPFAYLLSFTSILAMVAWLLWKEKLGSLAAPFAGLFLVGGSVSLLTGLLILPVSLLGLMVLIGILGFTPLFSSVVYLRNGVRAYRSSISVLGDDGAWRISFLAALFAFVVPYVINIQISNMISDVVRCDAATVRRQGAKLKYVSLLVDASPIAHRYQRGEHDDKGTTPRITALADVYLEITGKSIEGASYVWD